MSHDAPPQPSPWGRPDPEPRPEPPFSFRRDVPYRLYRLRRVWLTGLALPGLTYAAILGSGIAGDWVLAPASAILGLWVVLLLAVVILYPAGCTDEAVSGAAATSACLGIVALGVPSQTTAYALLVVPWMALLFGSVLVLDWGGRHSPRRRGQVVCWRKVTRPPGEALAILAIGPDRQWPGGWSGPAGPDGQFEIREARRMPDTATGSMVVHVMVVTARVLENGPSGQSVLLRLAQDPQFHSIRTVAVEDAPGGCRMAVSEAYENMPLLTAWHGWLQDIHADHMTDLVDQIEGRVSRAIRAQPLVSPLFDLLARLSDRPRSGD